jgi:hypothetical protein
MAAPGQNANQYSGTIRTQGIIAATHLCAPVQDGMAAPGHHTTKTASHNKIMAAHNRDGLAPTPVRACPGWRGCSNIPRHVGLQQEPHIPFTPKPKAALQLHT